MVEDDPDIAELLTACISSRWPDANVIGVAGGREGLLSAETEPPDLVVLDIGLPDIDGYQVLRQLRVFSDAPVVMLTGRDRDADIDMFLKEGALADDYIIKPVNLTDLVGRLEAVVRAPVEPKGLPADDGVSAHRQVVDENYEGTVRLSVLGDGNLGLLVNFVRQVHKLPDLRLLRMANDQNGLVEIWLSLCQPIPLRIMLGDIDGVVEVNPSPGRWDDPPPLTLRAVLAPSLAR